MNVWFSELNHRKGLEGSVVLSVKGHKIKGRFVAETRDILRRQYIRNTSQDTSLDALMWSASVIDTSVIRSNFPENIITLKRHYSKACQVTSLEAVM
ncbi:hypothetical protein J6590_088373 [Homalodisca vitripennis]|nr:hypothetical protein J6590_088373 [Homalodisca vitripennis]